MSVTFQQIEAFLDRNLFVTGQKRHKRDFTSSLILDQTNLNFFVIIAKIFIYWNDVWLWVFVRIYNHYHAYISFRIRNDDAADFEFEEEAWKSRGR